MLRITITETQSGGRTLQLSGNISDVWVAELRNCCEASLKQSTELAIDLAEVQYVDFAGLDLLCELRGRNVAVARWTPLVAEFLAAHCGSKIESA